MESGRVGALREEHARRRGRFALPGRFRHDVGTIGRNAEPEKGRTT